MVVVNVLPPSGCIHLRNIQSSPRMCLKYVVEANQAKLEVVAEEWRISKEKLLTCDQDEKVMQDPSVHAIVIATPTYMHKDLVMRGLKAGKAVFCEKPIAESLECTRLCYHMAQQVGRPLLCAFNRRFDPSFSHLRQEVHGGSVGQVQMVKTVSRDSPMPTLDYLKISGGIFHDCAVHDIDLTCWVLGEYPTHVFASATAFVPEIAAINDHDTAVFTMKFPSGALSMTDLSRNAVYGYDQRLEVFGPKGMVSAGNERPFPLITCSVQGETQPPAYYSFPSRYHQSYIRELDHFCDVIQGLDDLSVTAEDSLKVTSIASTLEKSVVSGKMEQVLY
ncbi:putative oxidoreductase YrbE [Chionoecetes opilio]|uniref:Putative oxidoreductase YrbE n=1 Tax=Chionoecetes opilio TaxID=41210 RepID=A0A8J4XWT3_CHIOP|nr:putative oxidoreductase YrbE [Chionoecetes opilio]